MKQNAARFAFGFTSSCRLTTAHVGHTVEIQLGLHNAMKVKPKGAKHSPFVRFFITDVVHSKISKNCGKFQKPYLTLATHDPQYKGNVR